MNNVNDYLPEDWKARQQALDPEKSFIVQAPAGSGDMVCAASSTAG